ncbi:MAG: alpha/beta hydrolase [Candidatus Eremiobacteraeota bacterium]|nr:alpha/beta hydrolase [Candidatus Eremiobacteraeota bacterium]
MTAEYSHAVSSDGVRLCVRTRGSPEHPAIVFIHGFSQCHLAWIAQFEGRLAEHFRLIAFDLRGHGWSDKPDDAAAYGESQRWGDDIAAVLATLDVRRAAFVCWSYGGRVMLDYLATHGSRAVAGINFVAAVIGDKREYYAPDIRTLRETFAGDPLATVDGTRKFVRACFALQPGAAAFERVLTYTAIVPPAIRAKLVGRPADGHDKLAALAVPVLFTHGTDDRIIAVEMSRYGAQTVPGARLALYDGIGHSPFLESSERFDRELHAFVRTCFP